MATVKDIGVVNYCDRVYNELSGMKTRLLGFVKEIEEMTGPEKQTLQPHVAHFEEIINTIDWKLEIISRVCPFEWTGVTGVESGSSVPMMENVAEKDEISGGYIGG
ncbi:MAG: hypothetical protein HZB33_11445 [Nitrospirae bacterium]|nr:hypothetical protein [Nitrospirota bacterium]